jgi:DNA-binding winged helix-turn-helix (wHTH) protein
MDQPVPRVLHFERFELDYTRGCARVAGREVELRPKAFDVLCHLAENAGRLVPKQELHDAVWGHVTVSDDALVQCIRELRQRLGDDDRSLIRTIARRGYLLNAQVVARAEPLAPIQEDPVPYAPPPSPRLPARPWYRGELGRCAAALLVVAAALGAIPLMRAMRPPPQNLVSVTDARHLAELAAGKELPVPRFQITSLAQDVPEVTRRYIGVWVSDSGWVGSDRQFMVIVTSVTRRGEIAGYMVNGPSKPYSRSQGPAFIMPFKGYVNADGLRYDGYIGMYLAALNRDGDMDLKLVFKDGVTSEVTLKPVWTLPKRERTDTAESARKTGQVSAKGA